MPKKLLAPRRIGLAKSAGLGLPAAHDSGIAVKNVRPSVKSLCLVVGAVAGLSGIVVSSAGHTLADWPAQIILPVVFSAIAAGLFVGSVLAPHIPENLGLPQLGARSALISALVSAGGLIIVATARSGVRGEVAFSVLPTSSVGLVTILPATLLGMISASFEGRARLRLRSRSHSPLRIRMGDIFWLLPFAAFCSPLLAYMAPSPVLSPPHKVPVTIGMPAATPPPFVYRKPADFDGASAAMIQMVGEWPLPYASPGLPAALAPDGQRIACLSRSSGAQLDVYSLDSRQICRTVALPSIPSALAWSTDGTKIFCIFDHSERQAGVADLTSGSVIMLPIPRGESLPPGSPLWWQPAEVAFFNGQNAPRFLNLDSLCVVGGVDSPKWAARKPGTA